jgi:hypothetical protein
LATKNEDNLEELKGEPNNENLRKLKSNWLPHATRMKNNTMSKITLNQMDEDNLEGPEVTLRRGRNRSIKA